MSAALKHPDALLNNQSHKVWQTFPWAGPHSSKGSFEGVAAGRCMPVPLLMSMSPPIICMVLVEYAGSWEVPGGQKRLRAELG